MAEQHHRPKEASYGNATNHHRRDAVRTEVDGRRPAGSTMGFGTEVLLDANKTRSPGTQVRGGPHRRDLHRQERGEGAYRVVRTGRGIDRNGRLHSARRAEHRQEKVPLSVVRKEHVMTAQELNWSLETIPDAANTQRFVVAQCERGKISLQLLADVARKRG